MRLAPYILANIEPILVEWEAFARNLWPNGASAEPHEVRDDAGAILLATAHDMLTDQTRGEQTAKAQEARPASDPRGALNQASYAHEIGRMNSGFDLWAVIAEYRALRTSVLQLWRDSHPSPDLRDLDDLTRFNESMDQSLTHAVRSFAVALEQQRQQTLERERASRREADEANRAKDVFLATLSHEMRTPLNAIVGWLSILRHDKAEPRHLREGLEVIERNTRAQVQLIDDVLDVSRIVTGKLRVVLGACQLTDVISAGVEVIRPAAESRNITIAMELDPSASSAVCDSVRMQQVVWNLVSNAVKFTPKGGRVDVGLRRDKSSLQIEVSDTGQGISAEVLPRVFDRFQQADSSTRRRHPGLGLGLSIVKYLVEAHGGTVHATSPGEGQGSTFTVRLPVPAVALIEDVRQQASDARRDERTIEAGSAVPHPGPHVRLDEVRVLVVDDQPDARQMLVLALERVGAVVTTAGSAREAIDTLAGARPDVLVSDLGMPDQDGFDLIRQVRAHGWDANQLPAVALTALVRHDDARLARLAGFQVHVPKPVTPHELIVVIDSLVGRHRGELRQS